eukprot:CAMPEP_0117590762 /NCGR_PEP_ID=MMETSP0784-20121206/71155_1 /TAXON_ID=39447 /ORGANISM="" /LENGTH=57 /DNA_ID=CAMNT_0005392405 /DNA_START=57 /DNA_END=226 /DNA_ORIENTATION=-
MHSAILQATAFFVLRATAASFRVGGGTRYMHGFDAPGSMHVAWCFHAARFKTATLGG